MTTEETKSNVSEKLLKKVRALKNQAEGVGTTEAEAQAFAAMFQKLMLEHKISMSDLEVEQMEKDSPVGIHYIDYTKYPKIKVRKNRVQWIEHLASIVGNAHFCRILVHEGSSQITFVGRHEDTVIAEYLLLEIQGSAEKMATAAYDGYRNELRKKMIAKLGEAGKRGSLPESAGFRESFIHSFISRLAQRMHEQKAAYTTGDPGCTALVRINRAEAAVADFMAKGEFSAARRARTAHVKFNNDGLTRGRAAADRINLVSEKKKEEKKVLMFDR